MEDDMKNFRPRITGSVDVSAELILKASEILAAAHPPKSVSAFVEAKLQELINTRPAKKIVGVWPAEREIR